LGRREWEDIFRDAAARRLTLKSEIAFVVFVLPSRYYCVLKNCKMTNSIVPESQPNPGIFPEPIGTRSRLKTTIPWLCIAVTILFFQIPQFHTSKVSEDYVQNLSLQLIGKYIVGARSLTGHSTASSRSEIRNQPLQRYMHTPQQLLAIPIIAELFGKAAAIEELNHIIENPINGSVARDAPLFLHLYRNSSAALQPQQRLSIAAYGWLGQLALTQDLPDSSPERRILLNSALRTAMVMALFVIVSLAALGAGLILLTVTIVLQLRGRLRHRFAAPENPEIPLLEGFAIYLTGFGVVPFLLRQFSPDSRLVAAVLQILAVIVGALWPRFRGLDWNTYRKAIGWHRGQGFFREVGAGILGYIAGLPLLMIGFIIVSVIARYAGSMPMHPIIYEMSRGPWFQLFWILMACVWAPIVEETMFRGALFGYLRRHAPWAVSGILTAFVFAAVHPQGWIGIPLLATIGFILSAVREWRGSIIASMSAHALNNATAVLMLVLLLYS
jgi:membrane protease YdiL (CAAX protease family)